MKCPKEVVCSLCGGHITYGYEGETQCDNEKCKYSYTMAEDKKGNWKGNNGVSENALALDWQSRALTAEAELTSLKKRIDGITVEGLMDIIKSPLYTYRQFEDTNGYLTKIIKTIIFDDGRLKQLAVAIHDKIKGV